MITIAPSPPGLSAAPLVFPTLPIAVKSISIVILIMKVFQSIDYIIQSIYFSFNL